MMRAKVLSIGLLALAAMGVGACADQYAYGRAPGYGNVGGFNDYNQYWGDPYGYRNVPVGFIGQGFGWYGNQYYPGNGNFVYDRRGVRRAWNQQQRRYWQPRIVTQRPVIGNRIGGAIARQGLPPGQYRQQNRIDRQRAQVDRQRNQVNRQRNQVERQRDRVERQRDRVERQRPGAFGQQNQRQNRERWQQQRQQRDTRQSRAERRN